MRQQTIKVSHYLIQLLYYNLYRSLKPFNHKHTNRPCQFCFWTGFLEDERELTNLQETLKLIASPELKLLVKSLHISTGNKGSSKEDTIETIVSLAENQKTLFGSLKSVVLKRYIYIYIYM